MTQNNIATHLSTRRVVLISLKNFENIRPDTVVLDLRGGQNPNNFFPASYDDAKKLAEYLNESPNYKKNETIKDQMIFALVK